MPISCCPQGRFSRVPIASCRALGALADAHPPGCLGCHQQACFVTPEEVVREANYRCNQENLHAQLKGGVKGGVRALRAPLNTLHANWAYMAIVAIAWSLKAWFALVLPVAPRWRAQHEADRERVLRMEFRSFVQRFILVPAQIVRTGRRLIYRLLAWRPDLSIFFRLLDAL
jgi:hypothetical protein